VLAHESRQPAGSLIFDVRQNQAMSKNAVILVSWLSILVFAVTVGYGLSNRWGRIESIIVGIPLLIWVFLSWRKIRELQENKTDLSLAARLIFVCLFSCVLMLGLEREFAGYLKQPWISFISLVWMTPSIVLFFRMLVAVRKDLYKK
jgi:hypothetical protein